MLVVDQTLHDRFLISMNETPSCVFAPSGASVRMTSSTDDMLRRIDMQTSMCWVHSTAAGDVTSGRAAGKRATCANAAGIPEVNLHLLNGLVTLNA